MNKSQWSAVYHYCTEYGYDTPKDLLADLKANGTVERSTMISDLDEYVSGKTYEDMYCFLEDSL